MKLTSYDKMLSEELTQETFYRAMINITSFRGECHIKTWLTSIAKNSFYTYLRKRKREVYTDTILESTKDEKIESPAKSYEEKEMIENVLNIISSFEERTKDIMIYRLFTDLTYQQIAKLYNISESSAKVIFFRGKAALHKELKGVYGYEI